MITSKPSLRSGFDCIIRPAPSGAGRTTPSQPGHYPLSKVQSRIDKAILSLWYRIFQVDSPTRLLCAKLLTEFISYNYSVPGTLIGRIIKMKLSPVKCLFRRVIPNVIEEAHHDSVVQSLWFMILHENFIKPYSSEHIIAPLLTKAFWTWVHADGPPMVHAVGPLVDTWQRVLSDVPATSGPAAWPARGELRLAALSPIPLSATERPLSHCDGRWYWVFGVGTV